MHDAFAPGGALAATLPGFEPRPEQAALAEAVEQRARDAASTSLAEAGTGTGQEPRLPAAGARVRAARRRRDRDEGAPGAAALERGAGRRPGARARGRRRRAQGPPELPLPQAALRASGRCCSATRATRRRARRCSRGSPRPRPATAPSCRSSRRRRCGPSSPSAPTAAPGRRCPLLSACFAEAARARAAEAELVIANHALYFADLAAGGGVLPEHDAVVFDEAHRLEETAATWLGGRVSRAGLRRLAPTSSAPAARPSEPVPGTRARPRRARPATGCSAPSSAASGRRRLREIPVETALVLVDALAALADGARRPRPRVSTSSRAARSRRRGAGRGVSRARPSSSASSGRSRTRSPGRPVDVSRGAARAALGRRARPRSSSRRR